eukprot:CAMPEP_0174291336 /NCGR_PEP_ID=MMETSP0809-20121228/31752_1 /TAXON_ID=73025 ORGANISM="Eutreptiella gymnastica-like, Strain CCMP1594" /NCGR_SAMPLE_ID=MMETSP0809 /ASSEMBLY_ACC=CAM_ASM_000658 /LENGTH=140 /DNA_ID=CAMNT_0015390577 /DNA_START=255 /DNA_END=679 /DNA_ORIENTATION=+
MELWGGGSLQKLRLCPHDLTNESITRYQHWLPHPRQPILASWPQLHTAGASLHNDSRTVDWVRQRAAAMKKYLSFTLSDADLAHNWDNAMQMENGTTAAAQFGPSSLWAPYDSAVYLLHGRVVAAEEDVQGTNRDTEELV